MTAMDEIAAELIALRAENTRLKILASACIGLMYNGLLTETEPAKSWLSLAREAGLDTEHPRSMKTVLDTALTMPSQTP